MGEVANERGGSVSSMTLRCVHCRKDVDETKAIATGHVLFGKKRVTARWCGEPCMYAAQEVPSRRGKRTGCYGPWTEDMGFTCMREWRARAKAIDGASQ